MYEAASGRAPFEDWLKKQRDRVGMAAIEARIGLLRRGSPGKNYREIGDGLIELKVDVGPGYRIYIADDGKKSLILLAGPKGSQKQDIKSAKQFWKDYKARRD